MNKFKWLYIQTAGCAAQDIYREVWLRHCDLHTKCAHLPQVHTIPGSQICNSRMCRCDLCEMVSRWAEMCGHVWISLAWAILSLHKCKHCLEMAKIALISRKYALRSYICNGRMHQTNAVKLWWVVLFALNHTKVRTFSTTVHSGYKALKQLPV